MTRVAVVSGGALAAVDEQIGIGVDRVAAFDQFRQHGARIAGHQQGPVVAPRHPGHQHVEIGAQPHRNAAPGDRRPCHRVHESAAAGRQHMRRLGQQTRDDAPLAVAEYRLAAVAEYLFDGLAGGSFDLDIRIEERQVETRRQTAADFGLAGAHQSDQHDRPARHENRAPALRFRSYVRSAGSRTRPCGLAALPRDGP